MSPLKYYLGVLAGIPCLPFLIRDGKRIRASVPRLPEAINPGGVSGNKGNPPLHLLTLGESTMAGVGVKEHKDGIAGTLADYLAEQGGFQVEWKVLARNGYTMRDVLHKLIPKIGDFQPDLIVLSMGGNDAFKANSPTNFAKAARQVIEALQAKFPSVPIVFMNMPPIKEFPAFTNLAKAFIGNLVEMHGQALDREVKKHEGVYYLSEIITLEKWINKVDVNLRDSDFFSDGVHPSQLTYQTWAKETGQFIIAEGLLNNVKITVKSQA